ncbi:hypothetical protein LT493_32540 [Streptomyces tricolor]|nr:hypothetical protein [Streptomyces tricolor]
MATIGGQVIGGLLIGADLFDSGWRMVFWVNVPIGIALLPARPALCAGDGLGDHPEAGHARRPGAQRGPLFLLVLPLIQGQEAGWPAWVWACFAGSAVAFGLFVAIERSLERRDADPLVPLTLFKAALVLAPDSSSSSPLYALIYSYYLALSVTMQQGLGLSALGAGLVQAPASPRSSCSAWWRAGSSRKYGRRVLEVRAIILAIGYLATGILLVSGPRITPLLVIPHPSSCRASVADWSSRPR